MLKKSLKFLWRRTFSFSQFRSQNKFVCVVHAEWKYENSISITSSSMLPLTLRNTVQWSFLLHALWYYLLKQVQVPVILSECGGSDKWNDGCTIRNSNGWSFVICCYLKLESLRLCHFAIKVGVSLLTFFIYCISKYRTVHTWGVDWNYLWISIDS